jgi:TRAP-type C4-dicarboxylate transport system substrate-binding protein
MTGGDLDLVAATFATRNAQRWLVGEDLRIHEISTACPTVTLRVSGHPPETASIVKEALRPAFRNLERMSQGKIQVQDTWNGKVHGDRDGAQALRDGRTDMALCYSPWDPESFPMAQALSLPGLFPNAEIATLVAESLYWDYFRQDVERQGLRMGRMKATGSYNLFSREPIQSGADLNGARIGCSFGPEVKMFSLLGATPVPLSSLQMADALASGAVDGISIADASCQVFGIHKHAKYRIALNLARLNMEFCLRADFWDGLPGELQVVLHRWLRAEAQAETQMFYGLIGAAARASFLVQGIAFLYPKDDELARWLKRLSPLSAQFVETNEARGRPATRLLSDIESLKSRYLHLDANALMTRAIEHPVEQINAFG